MSRIIVDSIRNSSASSDGITLSSDGKVAFPNNTGNILQVVQTAKTSEFTSTSTSYTDLTGLSATITPQTGNKVFDYSVQGQLERLEDKILKMRVR